MENNTIEYDRWALSSHLAGPVIALFAFLQLVLALPSNFFIIVHSFSNMKSLKKSAIILLFCLALSNLLMALFYMPFVVVASAAGEWIIGDSNEARSVLCQIHGFIYEYSVTVTGHILVIISFDRFIYIITANNHTKVMTWKVTSGIMLAVWILPILWCVSPYYGSGLGFYGWSYTNGGCTPFIVTLNLPAAIVYVLYAFVCFSIIVITTVWTFIYTHAFLKKNMEIRREGRDTENERHVYNQRVRHLVGIFGTLLVANSFSLIPYFITIFYTLVGLDLENIPSQVDATLFILSLSNTAANPIIQIYFRKDLRDSLKKAFESLKKKSICWREKKRSFEVDSNRKKVEQNTNRNIYTTSVGENGASSVVTEIETYASQEYKPVLNDTEMKSVDCDKNITPGKAGCQVSIMWH